ncbi:hypothetical protein CC85DRAFT_271535 [Cutaneotrichosporon oleaginosum]|uniref:Uncharacterized protein n=1 Tax=Cutaneotrichosporon oleaginosum TaxID=879819 RepID=A0A0J0XSJ3_9TREE|nr:uncharacterized protein CC85DRAFT_271535 [Cutaneotrichosporon oleaginosum]KLT44047.1 hypothetical protein CC85DRAFT_271535 [Cutaneotrichosporon oleaginosum]TXT09495.1 hypothetical protein COLE_03429 [Cutaneotrichosporon oleaginosum]
MRPDGRTNYELRPMRVAIGELDRADGSGRFEFGPAAALASFTGPIEVRIRDERVDAATLEVIHRPLDGIGATPSRALEDALRASFAPILTLNRFPRSLVQLVVQSLTPAAPQASSSPPWIGEKTTSWPPSTFPPPQGTPTLSGGMVPRAAAFNAASLAAMHAGSVGMRAVPLAVGVALVDGEYVLDPSAEEEAAADARFGFGWAFGTGISSAKDRMEDEAEEVESVWIEAEGTFTRQQVGDQEPLR